MNLHKIAPILLLIGISVFSPFEEILLIPFAIQWDMLWIIPAWTGFAIICLGTGIYLIGSKHIPIPTPIARHIWIFIAGVVMICACFTYILI